MKKIRKIKCKICGKEISSPSLSKHLNQESHWYFTTEQYTKEFKTEEWLTCKYCGREFYRKLFQQNEIACCDDEGCRKKYRLEKVKRPKNENKESFGLALWWENHLDELYEINQILCRLCGRKKPVFDFEKHLQKDHSTTREKYCQDFKLFCECGCGQVVTYPNNRFIHGHENKGKPKSEIHREHIRQAKLGTKCSEEHKRHVSEGHADVSGPNNPGWRGGSTIGYPLEFNEELKEQIRFKDNYKCVLCNKAQLDAVLKQYILGKPIYRFHVHHVDYDKKKNTEENLVTLCLSCHSKTGVGDRDFWTKLLQEGMGSTGSRGIRFRSSCVSY